MSVSAVKKTTKNTTVQTVLTIAGRKQTHSGIAKKMSNINMS